LRKEMVEAKNTGRSGKENRNMWDSCMKKGTRFFNQGRYRDAHEAWECHWLHMEHSNERTYIQGMIKVAAAYDKYVKGEHDGTAKLLKQAITLLDKARDAEVATDRDAFLNDVEVSYSTFSSTGSLGENDFPKIRIPGDRENNR